VTNPQSPSPPAVTEPSSWRLSPAELLVAAALLAATFLLYLPSLSNHFVDYDDHHYVTANKVVQKGLTREGLVWAFTTTKFANWLPVTWLSHMLDCELYGMNAGGHHATSALLHAFNAAALFIALRGMTGRFRESAAVAALFAVHPLRVESVSWVAERKDVLCGTFFMLALLAYAAYARRPSVLGYLAVLLCHALGLMSKTMLVTLPCVLLLLDFWPLRRVRRGGVGEQIGASDDAAPRFPARGISWLIVEKLPLVLLSVVSSAWTVVFQEAGGAMWGQRNLTLSQRFANAVVSVPRYLLKIVWPADLSVFYPHPGSWPVTKVVAATGLVLLLSLAAIASYRRRPYLTIGWFWFLGMLVPVSGVIQVGLQSMADRYTYLPGIGLLVALCWWVGDALRLHRRLVMPTAVVTALIVAVFSVATWRQQRHWKDTLTLFNKAVAADPDNWLAQNMIGAVYAANGERALAKGDERVAKLFYREAEKYTRKSLELKPDHYASLHNQAQNLLHLGRVDEAIASYKESIRVYPEWGYSHLGLGEMLGQLGRVDEAMQYLEEAVRLLPNDPDAHLQLANGLLAKGRKEEAAAHLREVLRLKPDHADAKYWLQQATAPTTAPATAPSTGPATLPATRGLQ
jgi:Flp pilus assembly protein TadD